jgi:hypothetical protein
MSNIECSSPSSLPGAPYGGALRAGRFTLTPWRVDTSSRPGSPGSVGHGPKSTAVTLLVF